GFSVKGEGKAMGNAAQGEVVQVRVQSGEVINGVAKADGTVDVDF
ncbi:MAG: flagella basal body P-ring formation protein FlgA, partial [Burkholderiales bacterium]